MTLKNLTLIVCAMLVVALLASGCNDTAENAATADSGTQGNQMAATPASTNSGDAAKAAGGCGGCVDGACTDKAGATTTMANAEDGKAAGACGDCDGGSCEDKAGATATMANAEGGKAAGACGDCDGGSCADKAGATATMANAEGGKAAGSCGDCTGGDCGGGTAKTTMTAAGGDCSDGGCGEGGAKPAGGCSTCPGTAKTLTAMACDEKVVLAVDGMTCTSCENAIRETLATVNGVKLGVADHTQGRAWVAYDPKVANVQVITAAISGLGYTVGEELDHVAAMPATPAGHERAAIYVDKLGCADCTPRVNEALMAMKGVDACALDRQYNILFVDYDPAVLQPVAFKDKMLEIGYAAAMPGETMANPEKAHCEGCTGEEHAEVVTADAA